MAVTTPAATRRRLRMQVTGAVQGVGFRPFLYRAATEEVDPHRELLSIEAIIRSRMGEPDRAVALVQDYLLANPGHTFDRSAGLAWWWRELETVPEFRRLIALRSES